MVHVLEADETSLSMLQNAYAEDPVMKELREALRHGWNWSFRSQAPSIIQPFWNIRGEIYDLDGFLYVSGRVIISQSECKRFLKMLHAGHLGIRKCRDRARRSFYWPGLYKDIEVEVASCESCAKFGNRQPREPLLPHEIPELPWLRVAMDILEFRSNSYLVVVDCYSHFPELRILRRKTAEDVVMALKSIFSVHGIPLTIMADNMPFNSSVMKRFAKEWCFSIKTSSPHYPRSNGMAERYVQTVKLFLKKCENGGDDVYRSLLAYRETAVTGLPYSPAEMLFIQSIRSHLPVTTETLRPVRTRSLPELPVGVPAWIRTDDEKHWSPGVIQGACEELLSYLVDNGQNVVRRNRAHLKPRTVPIQQTEQTEPTPTRCDVSPDQVQLEPSMTPARQINTRPVRANRGVLPARFQEFEMD